MEFSEPTRSEQVSLTIGNLPEEVTNITVTVTLTAGGEDVEVPLVHLYLFLSVFIALETVKKHSYVPTC